jgi:hypothetical protein
MEDVAFRKESGLLVGSVTPSVVGRIEENRWAMSMNLISARL